MLVSVIFFFTGIALVVVLLIWQWERSSFVRQIDQIPGSPKVPFFGNVLDVPRVGSCKLIFSIITYIKRFFSLIQFLFDADIDNYNAVLANATCWIKGNKRIRELRESYCMNKLVKSEIEKVLTSPWQCALFHSSVLMLKQIVEYV